MAEITSELVKSLRDKTNAGMMDCKRALTEANGDIAKAEDLLRTKGMAAAHKKAERVAKEGTIASYIHLQGKVGVLIEVNCETDFVAKNEIFREFVKDITLHIAAASPTFISREDVPADAIEMMDAAQVQDKSVQEVDKIVNEKSDKFFSATCLLEQEFVKNPDITIKDLVSAKIAELGENIVIRRFVRYALGG